MKQKITTIALAALLVLTLAPPAFAQQATSTDDGAGSLAEQIASLLEQVESLKQQLAELERQKGQVRQEIAEVTRIARNLSRGATGDDVEELQELLASDQDIYPEGLVTGFFGPLTEQAVERLQERFGIDQVGVVGPITRRTVNQLFGNLNQGRGSLNRGPGNIFDRLDIEDRDEVRDAEVDLSEFVPGTTGVLVCHTSSGFSGSERTIAIGGPAVQAHLDHGDTLGPCDDDDADDEEEEEQSEVEGVVESINDSGRVFLDDQSEAPVAAFIIVVDDETVIDEEGDFDSLEEVKSALSEGQIVRIEAEGELADAPGGDEGLLDATKVKFEVDDEDEVDDDDVDDEEDEDETEE